MTSPSFITAIADQRRFLGFTSDKIPMNPVIPGSGRTNDPETWGTYVQAREWARRTGGSVGFLALDDYLVLDFDGTVHDGVINPRVHQWIEALGAETEVSISGSGIHITVPMNAKLRDLVPTKRQIPGDDLSVRGIDLITGNNAVILGTPNRAATRPFPEQQAAAVEVVKELLALPSAQPRRSRRRSQKQRARRWPGEDGQISFDRNLAVAAITHNCARLYLGWLWIKKLDPDGTGFLFEEDVLQALTADFTTMQRKHPRKAAKRLVEQLVARGFVERKPFKQTGRTVLRLRGIRRLCQMLHTVPGERETMPRRECLSAAPKRWIYLGIFARRDSSADKPRPMSRAARQEETLTSAVTQRKAEKMAGARVEQNWVIGSPPPGRPWKYLADGRTIYQIAVSTCVRPQLDRERLHKHLVLVQRDDRRTYFYPDLDYADDVDTSGGLWFVRQHRLSNGRGINLWEPR